MARQRRGGGFRPPEIRGTLGTLLRTTLEQAGVVRDALERSAREGRSRLDEALSGRRRKDALAELGELVLDLIRRGEIDLGELPEAQDLVRHLDELDAGAGAGVGDSADADDPDDRIAKPPTRRRFDARSRDRDDRDRDDRDHDDDDDRAGDRAGTFSSFSGARDGTVSSLSGARRPAPSKPAAPPRVWRPTVPAGADEAPTIPESRRARALPRDPHRKGGIQFDDDDLADYMHPDDVPPKPPSDGDR
ncbi:MAG TPA: hypothetical protein VN253_19135 [Kofleriaceae bacterium]|nr:hypothetical protein [Kofleriaceae bacterium]